MEDLANNSPYNNIKFLGWLDREEILAKMKTSDIFVMVSSPETFGLVYLEAMASGCITIGAKREGIDGIIQNGENGFLCEPRNVDDLADTIDKIVNLSKESKERLLRNTFETVKGMTHKGVSDNYIEALQHVIAQSKVNKNENNPHNPKL